MVLRDVREEEDGTARRNMQEAKDEKEGKEAREGTEVAANRRASTAARHNAYSGEFHA